MSSAVPVVSPLFITVADQPLLLALQRLEETVCTSRQESSLLLTERGDGRDPHLVPVISKISSILAHHLIQPDLGLAKLHENLSDLHLPPAR